MRWPRFTLLQLLLVTALCGLLAGWLRQAWQAAKQSQLMSASISADGKLLVAMYWSGNPELWDISGAAPRRVAGFAPDDPVESLRFLDDGTLVFHRQVRSGSELVRYDWRTNKESALLRHPGFFQSWAVSPDGKTAATFDGVTTPAGATLDLWDLNSGQRTRQLKIPAAQFVYHLELGATGTIVAASEYGSTQIQVFDVESGRGRTIPGGSYSEPWALAADDKTLVVADWMGPGGQRADDCQVYVYELTDLAAMPRHFRSSEFATNIAVSRDGSRVLISSFGGIEVWDARTQLQLWKHEEAFSNPFNDLALQLEGWKLSADGSRVVRGGGRNGIAILDAATGQRLMTIGGTHRLRDTILYCTAFIGWAIAWGLVSRREKFRQAAQTPAPAIPWFRFRPTMQRQSLIFMLVLIGTLCGLLAWLLQGMVGDWLNMRPGWRMFLSIFAISFCGVIGYIYLKMRLWPLWGSLKIAQSIVGNTGRRQRHGKITGFFAGESSIERTYLRHIEEIRQKLAELLGREIQIKNELLVIGLARTDDFYHLNRTRLPHGGIVMTHWFADECRVCEELAHRDGTAATAMLRATIALALLRRHWRAEAPVWLSAVVSAHLAADEQRPAVLKRSHRILVGILGDDALSLCHDFVSMPPMERYKQIFQKDDPAILRELTLSQAAACSLAEYLLGEREGSPRDKMREVMRSVGRRGNIDEAWQRVFGHNAAELVGPWWEWVRKQPLVPWEPPPPEARWAIAELTRSIEPGSSLPLVEQQRNVTMLGAVCDLAVAPTLVAILEHPAHPLRAEALWSLRGISGERWDDDPARWRAWWQEVQPQSAAAATSYRPPLAAQWTGGPWTDDVVKAELATAIRAAENPNAGQPHEPWQLTAARSCIGAGGIWGIFFTIAMSFYSSTLVLMPTLGIGLLIGLLATARASGRHWWGLRTTAGLQTAAIVGCDPLQTLVGIAAAALLRGSDVKRYLQRFGGS